MNDDFSSARYVTRRIAQLVGADAASLNPNARAMLAQLRQASPHEPGTVPAVWPVTLEGVPEGRGRRQRAIENAIHHALTLFAIHQQAQSRSMHDAKHSFGRGVRKLADSAAGGDVEPHETPVYARFTAMCRASTVDGLVNHARGLVTQLRGMEIAFDYGRFTQDLEDFQDPRRTEGVKRRWGRDFHRFIRDDNEGQEK